MHNEGSDGQKKPSQITLKSLIGLESILFRDVAVLSLLPTSFVNPVKKACFLTVQ